MTGGWRDLTRYLGAFVTPNAPAIEGLLRAAVDLAPDGQFVSYQGGAAAVAPQVKALFDALQQKKLRYVNSVLAFSPEEGWSGQRVRLPRQTLESTNANCLDGTVLFASLLEAITLRSGDRPDPWARVCRMADRSGGRDSVALPRNDARRGQSIRRGHGRGDEARGGICRGGRHRTAAVPPLGAA